jgi:hypothetical protein
VSQEIRPPLKRGAIFLGCESPRNIAPREANLLGISPPFRNSALPPYKFWIFYLKTKRLQVEKIYCVIYLFITRRQNYIHILGFLAAGGVHSRHNHSFEILRLVSYSTHLKWNHCPQRSHKIMLSYSSASLHSHKVAIVTLLCSLGCVVGFRRAWGKWVSSLFSKQERRWLLIL